MKQTTEQLKAVIADARENTTHTDSLGHSGEQSEIEKLTQYITERVERGKMKITINALRDNLKNTKPFRGTPNLSKRLREHVLPILCEHNFITVANGVIYINPRLK